MSHLPHSPNAGEPQPPATFQTPRRVKWLSAAASVLVSVVLVAAVVLGITDDANGPLLALAAAPLRA